MEELSVTELLALDKERSLALKKEIKRVARKDTRFRFALKAALEVEDELIKRGVFE